MENDINFSISITDRFSDENGNLLLLEKEEQKEIDIIENKLKTVINSNYIQKFQYDKDNVVDNAPIIGENISLEIYPILMSIDLKNFEILDSNVIVAFIDKIHNNIMLYDVDNHDDIDTDKYNNELYYVEDALPNADEILFFIIEIKMKRKNNLRKGPLISIHRQDTNEPKCRNYVLIKYNSCNVYNVSMYSQLNELYGINWNCTDLIFANMNRYKSLYNTIFFDKNVMKGMIKCIEKGIKDNVDDFNRTSTLSSIYFEKVDYFPITTDPEFPDKIAIGTIPGVEIDEEIQEDFDDIINDIEESKLEQAQVMVVEMDLLSRNIPFTILKLNKNG